MSPRDTILRLAHEPGEALPELTETLAADERAELDAWLSARSLACAEVYDSEATPEQFRDDGSLFHDRLPSEDVDGFNPCVIARAPIVPPCAADCDEIPAWAYRTAGRA